MDTNQSVSYIHESQLSDNDCPVMQVQVHVQPQQQQIQDSQQQSVQQNTEQQIVQVGTF